MIAWDRLIPFDLNKPEGFLNLMIYMDHTCDNRLDRSADIVYRSELRCLEFGEYLQTGN